MNQRNPSAMLSRILEPVGRCLTRVAAQELVDLRLDKQSRAYLQRMAERSTEGKLTEAERSEYQSVVSALNLLSILQSKARQKLKKKQRVATI